MSNPVPPFWAVQRQIKIEEAKDGFCRLTAPIMPESFIGIRKEENGLWAGVFRHDLEGEDTEASEPIYNNELDAWNAAFEIFRNRVVV